MWGKPSAKLMGVHIPTPKNIWVVKESLIKYDIGKCLTDGEKLTIRVCILDAAMKMPYADKIIPKHFQLDQMTFHLQISYTRKYIIF